MLEETAIERYKSLPLPKLREMAQDLFNAFIRKRDEGKRCVTCLNPYILQAGHFYTVKQYPWLALDEDNCHGQCERCNVYLGGNYDAYEIQLPERIGVERFKALEERAAIGKRGWKPDRFYYIDLIIKYR